MPSAVAPNYHTGSHIHNDSSDRDQAVDDFMRDLELDNDTTNANTAPQEPAKDIDEEVQVKKKRKPNPKLDEARLLSQNGIPKLRRLTKSKLRFRGKGHEYADITALLNMYQLWLDDLYPKAKFRDGLAMVEKVGHSKRMQVTRRAWLDATKPHRREDSPERLGDVQMSGGLGGAETGREASGAAPNEQTEIVGSGGHPNRNLLERHGTGDDDAPEEDELDALLNENASGGSRERPKVQPLAKGPFEEDSDAEEDELDALLAEQASHASEKATPQGNNASKAGANSGGGIDDFEDDEEAMASMGW